MYLYRVKPGCALVQVFCFGVRPALAADVQFLALNAYIGSGGHGHSDEGIAANDRIVTDDSLAAQNRSAGIDGHVVLNGRMTLLAAQVLPTPGRQRADGNTLVDLDPVADGGLF